MSYIEKLLAGTGVEWKVLGEISIQINGMSGVTNKWAEKGNCRFIDYLNAYKHIKIDINQLPFATVKKLNQTELKRGDILFTSASETPDECAISSVIEGEIESGVFLDDHLFGIRINESYKDIIDPTFLNYYFHGPDFRKIVNKAVRGVTRFYISKVDFMKLLVPIPTLVVQRKIVDILDNFTTLEAELEAELDCRKRQYEYYRNQLLSFDMLNRGEQRLNNVKIMSLGELGTFIRGGGLQKKDFTLSGVGCIHYGQIYTYYGTYAKRTKSYVSQEFAQKARKAKNGDLIIATTSENDEDVCKAVAWLGDEEIAVSSDACFYAHTMNPKYVAYYFQTEQFQKQKRCFITGTKVRRVNSNDLAKIKILVPPLAEQERIASILDKFDTLTNSISEGLPKEIELRRKQYEYYRNQLLSFPEHKATA